MTKPKIGLADANGANGTREMTDEEFEEYLAIKAKSDQDFSAQEAAKEARQAVLDKLGLSEEEIQILLG
jgi:hypothetical protein